MFQVYNNLCSSYTISRIFTNIKFILWHIIRLSVTTKSNLHNKEMDMHIYFLHKDLILVEYLILQDTQYLQCFSGLTF